MANPKFWAGRRVMVTGHTGFKGTWLATWLAELGAEVTGIGLAPADRAVAVRGQRAASAASTAASPTCARASCSPATCARRSPRSCSTSPPSRWCWPASTIR